MGYLSVYRQGLIQGQLCHTVSQYQGLAFPAFGVTVLSTLYFSVATAVIYHYMYHISIVARGPFRIHSPSFPLPTKSSDGQSSRHPSYLFQTDN